MTQTPPDKTKPDAALEKRMLESLGTAMAGHERGRAVRLLAGLSGAQAESLSNTARLALLRALACAGDPPIGSRLLQQAHATAYRGSVLGPEFQAAERARMAQLAAAIEREPDLAQSRQGWDRLDNAAKLACLKRVAELHSRLWGYRPAPVVGAHEEPEDGYIRQAVFDPASGTITLNTHPHGVLGRFSLALLTVLHENTHNHQIQMATDIALGRLAADTPGYEQMRIIALNYTSTGIIPSDADYAGYLSQPMEQHADFVGKGVVEALRPPPPSPRARLGLRRPKRSP